MICISNIYAQKNKGDKEFKTIIEKLVKNWEKADESFDYEKEHTFLTDQGIRVKYALNKDILSLAKICSIVGSPIFKTGPHKEEMNFTSNEFGNYNPEFLKKLRVLVQNLLKNKSFVSKSKALYQQHFKNYLRAFWHSYHRVVQDEEVKTDALNIYKAELEKDPMNASYNIQNYFNDLAKEYESYNMDWYEMSTTAVFWLRRIMDGTERDFYLLMKDVILAYDNTFLTKS
jgi:hypothetical protein